MRESYADRIGMASQGLSVSKQHATSDDTIGHTGLNLQKSGVAPRWMARTTVTAEETNIACIKVGSTPET